MAASREGDTALWLHNKLGSTDDLWSGASICSQLSRDKLLNIHDCFHNLQPYVKVKLMLSFLHLPKRSQEEWKIELEDILQLAADDTDQWVAMVADLLRTYPLSGALNTDIDDHHKFFHEHLQELRKLVKKSTDVGLLPMECLHLGKNAMMSVAGHIPQPVKHFALKRKPKSAALRAELLQKSAEAANNLKKNNTTCTIPIKIRSFAKKMDNTAPMRGIPNKVPPSGGFLKGREGGPMGRFGGNTSIAGRSSAKREGGIKLLDISEMPVGAREAKRRRKMAEMEAMEKAKKEKEAQQTTPDYAAGLVSPAIPSLNSSGPSYAAPSVIRISTTTATSGTTILSTNSVSTGTQQARDNLQQQLQQQLSGATAAVTTATTTIRTINIVQQASQVKQNSATVSQPTQQIRVITQPPRVNSVQIQQQMTSVQPAQQPQQAAAVVTVSQPAQQQQQHPQQQQPAKKGLSLTKEQMVEAQAMFGSSNKVTRPEKALILGFMAGSRDNPCPQQGDIVNIRLSENQESVQQTDGTFRPMLVDVFFQMNYATGEWKRIKKYRPYEVEED